MLGAGLASLAVNCKLAFALRLVFSMLKTSSHFSVDEMLGDVLMEVHPLGRLDANEQVLLMPWHLALTSQHLKMQGPGVSPMGTRRSSVQK